MSGTDPRGSWPGALEHAPVATLGRIDRLRVLAAALPGVDVQERVIDAPFDRVWGWVSDLERSVPQFDADVAKLRVLERRGPAGDERLRIRAAGPAKLLWLPWTFDVDLRPGWCWMVSTPQSYLVGMAAEPVGEQTRFAHLEGIAFKGPRAVQAALGPLYAVSRWRHTRHLPHDLANIARLLADEPA